MLKPEMPNIPGMGAVTDTLEFVRNLWSSVGVPGTGIPGMVMPTLSVEEINKQIADLKAVESWLAVNMNMLRGTIQALEVQSATLSTLRSMGETLSSTVKSAAGMQPPASPQAATGEKSQVHEEKAAPRPEPKRKSRNNLKAEFKGETKPAREAAAPTAEGAADMQDFAPLANPAMWWNLLQNQFGQAMASAMPGEPARSKRRTAGKSASSAPRKRKSPPKR
ncbi:MAG TPA: PhaM family polyhydroxyalkanoate granule multifunctional regulatory protein [Burkholderiaceae bacterium]|jgi:hypothetical protein|nr:PhaM family polyhydroxyalkanoate granule multifunctional regulatory protein [Burkholderiaceae bacterium]